MKNRKFKTVDILKKEPNNMISKFKKRFQIENFSKF